MVHGPFCIDDLLPNIARSFLHKPKVDVIELIRPLTPETEAMLNWRLPGLSDSCRMLIYLHGDTYFELEKNFLPSRVSFKQDVIV
jgi:hypothetical protein